MNRFAPIAIIAAALILLGLSVHAGQLGGDTYEADIDALVERYEQMDVGERSVRGWATMEYRAQQAARAERQRDQMLSELRAIRDRLERDQDPPPTEPDPPAIEPVDPNSAGPDALKTLPGVGDAIAARIISHRDAVDPPAFLEPHDLSVIRGISDRMVDEWLADERLKMPGDGAPVNP